MLCTLMLVLCTVKQLGAEENTSCDALIDRSNVTYRTISPIMEKYEVALLQLLGFGGFSVFLAMLYNKIRKCVFNDAGDLDTTFDAGGNVSTSLTAVTVASQLLWPGVILQVATVTAKEGIGTTYWFVAGAYAIIIYFPVFSQQLKTKTPGAKTFLQLIYARFGKEAHILFTTFALLINLVVLLILLVSGIAIFQAITKDASPEFCVLLIATLFGCYSLVGGLGTTFYVSYFNTALIFIVLVILINKIFYSKWESMDTGFGNFDAIYKQLSCLGVHENKQEKTYLIFASIGGLVWFVQGVFAGAALMFCDQAAWQSRIAAKPLQGTLGYFLGISMAFSVVVVCSSTGLAYQAISSANSSLSLHPGDIDAGLVMPFVMERVIGYSGGVMMLTMLTMALMSTGSGEVMAISSIIVYDIYQIYINPFRKNHTPFKCLLCGEMKHTYVDVTQHQLNYCRCPAHKECRQCAHDKINSAKLNLGRLKVFSCEHHGQFQSYQRSLIQFKSWCIMWVTIALVPVGLVVNVSGIDLNWLFMAAFTLTTPCFHGALLTIMWVKTTKQGIIAGALTGVAAGLTGLLALATTYEGGLSNFIVNTSQHYSGIAGTGCGFFVSLFFTVIVSLFTHKITDSEAELMEWQKLRDIDNPLSPWADTFRKNFPGLAGERPSADQLNALFKQTTWFNYIGGAVTLLLLIVLIPSTMSPMGVLTSSQFSSYLITTQMFCFVIVGVVVFITPVEEIMNILNEIRKRKRYVTSLSPCQNIECETGNNVTLKQFHE